LTAIVKYFIVIEKSHY